jgi:hypothetical protein
VTRIARHLLILGALCVMALPATAFASANEVIHDCAQDGDLDGKYSNAELRGARDHMPSDLDEYSDCRDVIASAIKGGSNRGTGAGSPGIGATDPAGEAAAKANDAADLSAITGGGESGELGVGGANVEPDSSGFFNLNGAANEVPLPLLLALLLLCALAVASGIGSLRERVPALARITVPSKIQSLRVPFFGRRS